MSPLPDELSLIQCVADSLFDAEKCLEKLDEPARQALKKFRDDNPDLPLSTSAGACLGVVPTSLSKPCTTACRQAHPSKCLGNGQRDVIGFATSAKGDKYANWRTLCRSCDNALQRHVSLPPHPSLPASG